MGRFKKIVQFEKENMPEYQYNYLYHGLLLGLVFVLGGALICVIFIVIGAISDIMLLGLIPVCLWGLVTIALLILFVVHTKKLSKRLTNDKTVEFENYYALIDYETAKNELAKENFIVDGKLIFEKEDDVFAAEDIYSSLQESIDLEDCDIEFFCKTLS